MVLNLPIREVLAATPRARIVRLALDRHAFDYAPGQAVLVGDPGSAGRPYSLAAAPEETGRNGFLELLIGLGANGAPGPHLTLEPGRTVTVEGPLGSFTFPDAPAERRFLFVAGGTGIAPLRAMLHRALGMPDARIGVFYSARTPEEFAYEPELRALAGTGRIALRQTVTRAGEGAPWDGGRGRIGRAELQALVTDPETLCFVCGPRPFVADMVGLLGELGIQRTRIRIEEW